MHALHALIAVFVGAMLLPASPAGAAVITVTTTADEDSHPGAGTGCSLREALEAAATDAPYGGCPGGSGPDTIVVPAGTISIGSTLVVDSAVTIQGAGSGATTIDASTNSGDSAISVEGAGAFAATMAGLTVRDNSSSQDGAVYNGQTLTMLDVVVRDNMLITEPGAGVENDGTLTWTGGVLSGNTSDNLAGGFDQSTADGTATLEDLLITDNHATGDADAGALAVFAGSVTVRNSTLSGNDAEGSGGAIQVDSGFLTLQNVTVTDNTADVDGDGPGEQGGGIYNSGGSITITNSILAGNHDAASSPDCSGTVASGGGNVIGTNEECDVTGAQASDVIGSPAAPVDPGLGLLADNGGPTLTHALSPGSPAVDRAAGCPAADQRGMPRPQGAGCDSGAYELGMCKGLPADVFGTEGDDVLPGTTGPDGILGFGGNDVISGDAGDDVICSGAGKDRASGGAGKDRVLGEGGKDRLGGQGGRDRLNGGGGKDRLNGGGGRDRLVGAAGSDRCNGGAGKDRARKCEKERNVP